MSYRSANPFSAAKLLCWLAPIAEKFPRTYLLGLSGLASVGFLFLLGIPLLMVIGLFSLANLATAISADASMQNFLSLAAWGLVCVYTGILSWTLLRMRLPLPQGLLMKAGNFPALQALLQKLHEHFQVKPISRITITERYELRVSYTPRFGLPFWSTPTLCIGMPVLQCLSTKHFSCLLAGQIGQHASPYSRWVHQLKKSQQVFKQYRQYFDKERSVMSLPLRLFFRLYQPVYTSFSVFASQWDELEADRYSLEIYSGAELLETMLTSTACKQFLKKRYWPDVVKRLQKEPPQKSLPHTRMSSVIRRALAGNKTNDLLHESFKTNFDGMTQSLSLKKRMENIGYDDIQAPTVLIKNASHELLESGEKKMIDFMDKLWVSRNLADWKKVQNKLKQKQAALSQLDKQSVNRLLTADELWKQARLTERLHNETAAIPLYQALLQKDSQHPKGLFAYGRILLRRGDSNGIKLLEQAMSLESALTPQACTLLFKFLSKHNQKQRAMLYRNRGLSFRQQHAA